MMKCTLLFLSFAVSATVLGGSPTLAADLGLEQVAKFSASANADGGTPARYVHQPVVTPDGSGVLVDLYGGSRQKLYLFNSDGSIKWTYPAAKNEFLGEAVHGPLITADGVVIVVAYSGKVYSLDVETGVLNAASQLVDTEGRKDVNGQGSFGEPSLGLDGKTVIVPSNSGLVQFVKDGRVSSSLKLACEKSDPSSQKCYFFSPVRVRNDGTMAVVESGRLVLFDAKGVVVESFSGGGNSNPSVSEDGSAFVGVLSSYSEPEKFTFRILVAGPGAERKEYALGKTEPYFAIQTKDGSVVFTAQQYGDWGSTKCFMGTISPGATQPKLQLLPQKGRRAESPYTYPVRDRQGRTVVVTLSGDIFAFGPDGKILDKTKSDTEFRAAPVVMKDGTVVVAGNGTIDRDEAGVEFYRFAEKSGAVGDDEDAEDSIETKTVILDRKIGLQLWTGLSGATLKSLDEEVARRGIPGSIICESRNLEFGGQFVTCLLDKRQWNDDEHNDCAKRVVTTAPAARLMFEKLSAAFPDNVVVEKEATLVILLGAEKNIFSCRKTAEAYSCRFDELGK